MVSTKLPHSSSFRSISSFVDFIGPTRRFSVSSAAITEELDPNQLGLSLKPLPEEDISELEWDLTDEISDLPMVEVYERLDEYLGNEHDYNISSSTLEVDFLLKLAFALTINGMPSTAVESHIIKIAKRLGFTASVCLSPRQISLCFTPLDSTHSSSRTRTFIIHCDDVGSVSNVASLSLLYNLAEAISEGTLSLESAFKGLLDILQNPQSIPRRVEF
ncbi:hypothetical protein GEMRC1_007241 [Eukaryota sp. GEM-RC1]